MKSRDQPSHSLSLTTDCPSARLRRATEVVALDLVAGLTVGVAGVAVRLAGRLGCLAATELDGAGGLFQCRRHQRQRSSVA